MSGRNRLHMMPSKGLRLHEFCDVGGTVIRQRGQEAVDRRQRLAQDQGRLAVAERGQPGQGVQGALA